MHRRARHERYTAEICVYPFHLLGRGVTATGLLISGPWDAVDIHVELVDITERDRKSVV